MRFFTLYIYVLLLSFLAACTTFVSPVSVQETSYSAPAREDNMALGNPSGAGTAHHNYLIKRPQYAMSYHRYRATPNWVSWHLNKAWLGSVSRQNDFRTDTSLPADWYRASPNDYQYSGFDRGHMCPSADRTASVEDNSATFLMTNILPQAPNNNRQTWEQLESYCRRLVDQGYELYIIAGNRGTGGEGSNGYARTIANGNITVPSHLWKVIVVLPEGSNDLSRINTSTRTIAVIMPNTQDVNQKPWTAYRVSIRDVERLTGYNFLSNVPQWIQDVIETRVDNQYVAPEEYVTTF